MHMIKPLYARFIIEKCEHFSISFINNKCTKFNKDFKQNFKY